VSNSDSEPTLLCWPLDHFYSPVANSPLLAREPARSRLWPPTPRDTPGLDWRESEQLALLESFAARAPLQIPDADTGDPHVYHAGNPMFSRLDAWMLQSMLRHFRPRKMIEIGCGFSTLMSARIGREHLAGELELTCIEPYPPDFLSGLAGVSELIQSPVEQVPVERFLGLRDGDVLFIDSSHTVKTGGDVAFLYQEVIPRLAPGVIVHVHDMFIPHEYPFEWVMDGRAWNEQYLVRAFLSFNSEFSILLSVVWLAHHHRDALIRALPAYPENYPDGGGSLWYRRNPR
jgi:Methyltransferase domain